MLRHRELAYPPNLEVRKIVAAAESSRRGCRLARLWENDRRARGSRPGSERRYTLSLERALFWFGASRT